MKNFLNIISITGIFFSTLLLAIFTYKRITIRGNLADIYTDSLFLVIIFFIVLLIISFYLEKKVKVYLFIILGSIIASSYLFEVYISLSNYYNSTEYHAKKKEKNFDSRSRYEFYLNYKKVNNDSVISIPPFIVHREYLKDKLEIKTLPLSGISKSKTVFCNESGYFVDYLSDRYGFNNPDQEWNKNKQILFLGDSYVHGVCVFEKDTITGNLRSKISNKNYGVINLGQRGNGPLSEYAGLVEYSKNINPKIILWVYYEGNDLKNLRYEKQIDILNNYLILDNFSQDLVNKQLYLDKLLKKVLINRLEFEKKTFYYIENNKFLTILKLHNFRKFISKINFRNKSKINYKNEIRDFKVLLERANSFAKKKNANFLFVYVPSYKRIIKKNSLDEKLFNYKEIIEIIEDLNISYIDLNIELLQKAKDPLLYYPYGLPKHFNEEGYKSISNIIFKKINNYIN